MGRPRTPAAREARWVHETEDTACSCPAGIVTDPDAYAEAVESCPVHGAYAGAA